MSDARVFLDNGVTSRIDHTFSMILRIFNGGIEFFRELPTPIQATCYILVAFAVVGILMSHVRGIMGSRGKWKVYPNSNLTYSLFCGSGDMRRRMTYRDARAYLYDSKWSWVSMAGLAYRLGNYSSPSRAILFVCSLAYLPAVILGIGEMVARDIVGTIYLVVLNMIHLIVSLALRLISYLLIPLWKMVDRIMRIDQHCPHCYESFNLPAFRCPHCGETHKNLRPSRCGMMFAHCKCGGSIASSVLTGRSRIDAVCPMCAGVLVAANAKQFTLQLIGGSSSGKTTFLAALQHQYSAAAGGTKRQTIVCKPDDCFASLENMFRSGLAGKSLSTTMVSYSLLHTRRNVGKFNLVVNEIPADVLLNRSHERNPRYFGLTDGIVFIVDPLSVEAVREECRKNGDYHCLEDIESYDNNDLIVEFVHQFSSITGRSSHKQIDVPVAIVISKVDIKAVKRHIGSPKIKAVFNREPRVYKNNMSVARDVLCRKYLEQIGLGNTLNNIDGVFSKVQCFPVSAIGHSSVESRSFEPAGVLAPLSWIAKETNASFLWSNANDTQEGVDRAG